MTKEIWKPVPHMDGVIASSWGRIKFPDTKATFPKGGVRVYKTRPRWGSIQSGTKTPSAKYRSAWSQFFGNVPVHRAVCAAFHGPPPFDGAVVIHLDDDGLNNTPENLKWGTQKENMNMPRIKAYHRSRTGENSAWAIHKRRKKEP